MDDTTRISPSSTDTTQTDPPTLISPAPAEAPAPASAPASAPARTRKPRAPKASTPPAPKAPPDTVVNVLPKGDNVVDKLEALPTPGGLVLLLAIIALFLFAIVPVSGKKTRLRLLWDTVRGTTRLPNPTLGGANTSAINGFSPGALGNTESVMVAPTLAATGTGSPLSPAMTAAAAGMSASGYDDNSSAYPDAWQESSYLQSYPGETEYIVPDFPEY